MEITRFDRFAKSVGRHVTRRAALGPLAALGLGWGLAPPRAGDARRRTKRQGRRGRSGLGAASAGLRLLEELTETLTETAETGGDCDALREAATQFQEQNKARIKLVEAETLGWDEKQRAAFARRDQQRTTAAAERLHTLMATCGYRQSPVEDSLLCNLPPGDAIDAGEGTCQGCNCRCICPIPAGLCAAFFFACIGTGGAHHTCCWFGTCVRHNCLHMCPDCCGCNIIHCG